MDTIIETVSIEPAYIDVKDELMLSGEQAYFVHNIRTKQATYKNENDLASSWTYINRETFGEDYRIARGAQYLSAIRCSNFYC